MTTLDILYEDENLIAVNKPAGLLVTPDRWNPSIPTIQDMIREYIRRDLGGGHPNIRVVHRLDKDTSGVTVLAKNVKTQTYLSRQFEKGEVHKTYYAIVKGVMSKDDGIINYSLMESPKKPGIMMVSKSGKQSISVYKVLERFKDSTYVEVNPLTGRQHQVRVHMMASGYPLLFDPIYGEAIPLYLSDLKKNYKHKEGKEKPFLTRLTLHAFRLSLKEPAEGKTLVLEAPLPEDLSRTLKYLRKYSG
jgi:23S rRNA pseudouridine955/2504/2580 synthase/23S rRNA pseudouridine1911/1915/1917 synthase